MLIRLFLGASVAFGVTSTVHAQSADPAPAATSMTVKLDRTPPTVTLFSPYEGEVFPTETTMLTLRGSILDHGSGVANVTCNGGHGVVTGNGYSCAAPVVKGVQTVRVAGTDRAGNVTSRQVSITVGTAPLTLITISPAKMTLGVGERRPIAVIDQTGRPVSGWTVTTASSEVSDILTEDGSTFVRAVGPGQTTLTASLNGLTATALVTIVPAARTMRKETLLWSLTPSPSANKVRRGEVLRPMIGATATDNDPSLYFIDYDREGASPTGRTHIRAATFDGHELWRHVTTGPVQHAAADNDGGLTVVLADGSPFCCDHTDDAIRRIDPSGRVAWEYLQVSSIGRLSDMTLSPDGRVFVVERRNSITNQNEILTELVALDSLTGTVLHRWALGYSVSSTGDRYPLQTTHPIGLEDGSLVVVAHRVEGQVGRLVKFRLHNNELVETPIHGGPLAGFAFVPMLRGLIPDGHGGFLVASDNTATIYRVTSTDTLVGPLELGTSESALPDHVVQMALGENGAVALIQDWWGSRSYSSAAKIVFFNPLTMTVTQEQALPEEVGIFPRLMSYTLAGGGVAWRDMSNGFASEVAPGFLAGWIGSEPGVVLREP